MYTEIYHIENWQKQMVLSTVILVKFFIFSGPDFFLQKSDPFCAATDPARSLISVAK